MGKNPPVWGNLNPIWKKLKGPGLFLNSAKRPKELELRKFLVKKNPLGLLKDPPQKGWKGNMEPFFFPRNFKPKKALGGNP